MATEHDKAVKGMRTENVLLLCVRLRDLLVVRSSFDAVQLVKVSRQSFKEWQEFEKCNAVCGESPRD